MSLRQEPDRTLTGQSGKSKILAGACQDNQDDQENQNPARRPPVWWAIRTKPPTSKFASSKYRPI